jgi:molybdate transport system substrate-binding protein
MNARLAASAAALLLSQVSLAQAAEVKVVSSGGIRPPLEELVPEFGRASGHKVALTFVVGSLVRKEAESGAFDVVIGPAASVDELVKAGKVSKSTRADVARAGVGVAVKAGAPKPDVRSVDAFKRTLLSAKAVAYNKEGTAGSHFFQVLERLGIAKEMQPKLKSAVGTDLARGTGAMVRNGEADIGIAAVATLFTPGLDFVAPIPAELQSYTHFAAGVSAASREQQAAAAWVRFITAPGAASAFKAKGMEPAPQR